MAKTNNQPVVKWMPATETVASRHGFDYRSVQAKDYETYYSQLPCLAYSNKRDSVKHPTCVVDRWAQGSLTKKT